LADAELSERVQQAAESSLKKLRESAPLIPKEVADLRKRIDSLEDEYEKLKKKLDTVENKNQSIKK
jgi:peptidoglycan hydrolase CwlO-like protein